MLIANLLGYIGFSIGIVAYHFKTKKHIQLFVMSAMFFMGLHYLYIGAYTGFALAFIGIIRTYFYLITDESKNILFIFVAFVILGGLLSWDGYFSIFATMGMVLGTYANWLNKPEKTRVILLLSNICWIIYAISIGSMPSFLASCFSQLSILLAIYRLDKKQIIHSV